MKALTIGVIGALAILTACGTDVIDTNDATSEQALVGGGEKVTLCHATGSETNPYVEMTVSVSALPAHEQHQGLEDIIPAPGSGCPGPEDCGGGGACGQRGTCGSGR